MRNEPKAMGKITKYILVVVAWGLLLPGCKDDDEPAEPVIPNTGLYENTLTITNIHGLPKTRSVVFDRVEVEITGCDWGIIGTVGAAYADGKIVISLPTEFTSEELMKCARDDWKDYTGFWPAATDNPDARVAALGNDIVAYLGDRRVGRIYLTDWTGEGSTTGKSWVYYHYADRPFALSGNNFTNPNPDATGQYASPSFRYRASFAKGWNAYINSPQSDGGIALCTTDIPADKELFWRFEAWPD